MSINFVQSVPFINGHHIVVSDLDRGGGNGTLVIEAYNAILDDWMAVRMCPSPCTSRPEALGIAVAYAAQVLNHLPRAMGR